MDAPSSSTARRVLPLLGWLAALAAVLAVALALGRVPALAAPPFSRPGEILGWATAREPLAAAFAILRLVVVALACYLLVTTLLAVGLRLGGAGRLVTSVEVLSLPWVRGVVHGALGVGLVGAALASAGSATGHRAAPHGSWVTAVEAGPAITGLGLVLGAGDLLVRLPDVEVAAPTVRRLATPLADLPSAEVPVAPDGTQLPHPSGEVDEASPWAGDDEVDGPDRDTEEGALDDVAEGSGGATGSPGGAPPGEVAVAAGDHLWSLAEQALSSAWGAPPSDAEITGYWRALVDANHDRLVDPSNPDLVFPGQVLVLVAPPAAP